MINLHVLLVYIIGFLIFFVLMEIVQFDKLTYKFFNRNEDPSKTHPNINPSTFLQTANSHTLLQTDDSKKPLKLSKEQIGRHTWALLHSVAATYPSVPTEENKKSLENFLISLSDVFPCHICRTHFKEMLKNFPIKHSSREEFVYYLCDLHNKVNKRLNKPIYDCAQAFDIWGGDCGCEVENK